MSKKEKDAVVLPPLLLQETTSRELAGFGENVVKLTDKSSGEIVCFLGKSGEEEKVFFGKAVSPEQVDAVSEFLQRKKLQKYIGKGDFEKAQVYADRKFG